MKNIEFRILLVEDNPDHAKLVKSVVERAKHGHYTVEVVGSAEEAIPKITNGNYSLIVSDYKLPGKNGIDLLAWLNEKENDTPLIMLTGEGDEKVAVKSIQEGAYNYIVKDSTYVQNIMQAIDDALLAHLSKKEKEGAAREEREKSLALEKVNEELKKLDQFKSDFIASVSHEIRTPLNSVQESISMIREGLVDPRGEKGKRLLEIAKRNIERLTVMINDLLDFSKIEAGKIRLHFGSCNIQELIDDVVVGFRTVSDAKKVTIVFALRADFPAVYADGERITQVVTNLINNAIKFTPENGRITIECGLDEGGMCRVSVSDTGIGIPKADQDRIFERFEQSEYSNKEVRRGSRGTGLGLSVCREFVRMHRGDIWVESVLGKGSCFTFTVPLSEAVFNARPSTTLA